jgi:phosphatidylinositol glycan class T
LILSIPYSKLTIKYTEHRPDAERGVELPSGVLTLLDLQGEEDDSINDDDRTGSQPRRSGRTHIYTTRLLLDLPTPDFSMPYNVIIMSSTVMAVFFGLMQGALTRRWGFVEVSPGEGEKQKSVESDTEKPSLSEKS